MLKTGFSWTVKRRLQVTFFLLAVLTFIFAGVWTALLLHRQTSTETARHFIALSDTLAEQVSWLLEKEIQSAETFIRSQAVRDLTVSNKRLAESVNAVEDTMNLIYSNPPAISIFSADGLQLYSSPNATSFNTPPDMEKTGAFLRHDEKAGEYFILFSFAIPDSSGTPSNNRALFAIGLSRFEKHFSSVLLGDTGHANLVDSAGSIVVCPVFPPFTHNMPVDVINNIFANDSGSIDAAKDGHGPEPSLLGYSRVKFLKKRGITDTLVWSVAVRQTKSEIFAPLIRLYRQLALFWLALLSFFLFINYRLISKLFQPLGEIEASTLKIRDGLFSHRLRIESTDEFGQLARAFDDMATRLESREYLIKERERLDGAKECIMELSDQVRNPLASVILASRLLTDKFEELSEHDKLALFQVLKKEAGTLSKYFDDFVYAVELPAPSSSRLDFESFMKGRFLFWSEKLLGASAIIREDIGDGSFNADPEQLDQAIRHLILYMKASNMKITDIHTYRREESGELCTCINIDEKQVSEENRMNGWPFHYAIAQRIITHNGGRISSVSGEGAFNVEFVFPVSVERVVKK